jgi:hypothetical protein
MSVLALPDGRLEISAQGVRDAASLRTWLADRWAILFSHPEDFAQEQLEMDRWVSVLARSSTGRRRSRPRRWTSSAGRWPCASAGRLAPTNTPPDARSGVTHDSHNSASMHNRPANRLEWEVAKDPQFDPAPVTVRARKSDRTPRRPRRTSAARSASRRSRRWSPARSWDTSRQTPQRRRGRADDRSCAR